MVCRGQTFTFHLGSTTDSLLIAESRGPPAILGGTSLMLHFLWVRLLGIPSQGSVETGGVFHAGLLIWRPGVMDMKLSLWQLF